MSPARIPGRNLQPPPSLELKLKFFATWSQAYGGWGPSPCEILAAQTAWVSFILTFKGGWRAEDTFFVYRRLSPSGLQEGPWGLRHQVTDCKEHLAKAGKARGWGSRGKHAATADLLFT